MADGIDEATAAFREAMDPSEAKRAPAREERQARPERMFAERQMEDDDSPAPDGLDGEEEDENEKAPPPRKQKRPEPADGDGDEDDDGDEESEEQDPDQEEEDEDSEDEDPQLSAKYEVVVDGKPTEVSVKEALQGYIRQETFSQRMSHLSEAAKGIEGEAQKVIETRDRYAQALLELEEDYKAMIPAKPDWDKLYAEDPLKARQLQTQYEAFDAKLSEIRSKRDKAMQEAAAHHEERTAAFAKSEFSRFIADNRISTKQELQKELTSMRQTAASVGFSEQEVATVYDSRMLTILRKASKYDRMMAARPKPVQTGKKTIAPGAGKGSARTAPKGLDRAQRQLARTGSIDAAADVFRRIL